MNYTTNANKLDVKRSEIEISRVEWWVDEAVAVEIQQKPTVDNQRPHASPQGYSDC